MERQGRPGRTARRARRPHRCEADERNTRPAQVKDETTWEAEIAAFDAAAELVPDAHWRDKGRAAVVEDVSKRAITNERSVAVAAWDALRGSDGGPYTADDAWLDMEGPARSLILVGGSAHESTFLPCIVAEE